MDGMPAQLADGQRFRVLPRGDHVSRVSPALSVARSLTGRPVVENGSWWAPQLLCVEKGAARTSRALDVWAHQRGVTLRCSRPGSPTDHPRSASLNTKRRAEGLEQPWFTAIEEAAAMSEPWRADSNMQHSHRALGGLTPNAWEPGCGK
jgi:putative transposase